MSDAQPEGYTNGNPEDGEAIEARIRGLVEHQFPELTFAEVQNEIFNWVKENVDVVKEPVPKDIDRKRDEVYFTDPIDRVHKTNEGVKFLLDGEYKNINFFYNETLTPFLKQYGLSDNVIEYEYNDQKDVVEVVIQIPFWSKEDRKQKVEQTINKKVNKTRQYRDVNEDTIQSMCGKDDCDGMVYRDGMGSVGPRFKCTRKDCSFEFERDVL